MDHEQASQHLADLSGGFLGSEDAAAVTTHVAGCDDCATALATMRTLRATGPRGAILLEPHPSADQVVRLAGSDGDLPAPERTEIASHVRACPECGLEHRLAAEALHPPISWRERLLGLLRTPGTASLSPGRMAALALILLMSYPAYLGLRGPGQIPSVDLGAVLDQGAGTRLLYLPAARRGSAPVAALTAPGSAGLQPIALELEASLLGDEAELRFVLRREETVVWTLRTPTDRVFNPDLASVSVLVPDSRLTPGDHELDVTRGATGEVLATFPFRVVP